MQKRRESKGKREQELDDAIDGTLLWSTTPTPWRVYFRVFAVIGWKKDFLSQVGAFCSSVYEIVFSNLPVN